jgi:hypothetical protein
MIVFSCFQHEVVVSKGDSSRWLETRVEIRPIENLGSNKSNRGA